LQRSTQYPEMKKRGPAARWVDPKELIPWERNPRQNDDAVQGVANSILKFGFGAPILARKENNEIIAGHTRHKAALLIDYSPVPVRFLDLTENQSHALAIVDNNLSEVAMWDEAELEKLLEELDEELSGVYDDGDEDPIDDFCQEPDQEDTEEETEESNTLLDKLNAFVARSEQKSRQKKVWSKADHKALLRLAEEVRAVTIG